VSFDFVSAIWALPSMLCLGAMLFETTMAARRADACVPLGFLCALGGGLIVERLMSLSPGYLFLPGVVALGAIPVAVLAVTPRRNLGAGLLMLGETLAATMVGYTAGYQLVAHGSPSCSTPAGCLATAAYMTLFMVGLYAAIAMPGYILSRQFRRVEEPTRPDTIGVP
jgi:hypothetical protein